MADQGDTSNGATRDTSLGQRLRRLGPGLLVAAAFVGPGTVTTASVAGADFGYALIWALIFAIVATMILQEMSARLGIVSREGLGEALRSTFDNQALRIAAVVLVIGAIVVGNAAFQTGNVSGAALGLEAMLPLDTRIWALIVGVAALAILASGIYEVIEKALIGLVGVMSFVFIVTAVMVRPDISEMFAGSFVPTVPTGALITVVALIGTTVVPYNLFLHASSVREKWGRDVPTDVALSEARTDTYLSITIGGLVTVAIIVSAAATLFVQGIEVEEAADMAVALEPLLGPAARWFFAIGLFAAGITSSVTAPLAAAYAAQGAMGWEMNLKSWRFRAIWLLVLVVGTGFAAAGQDPVQAIVFAQVANGLLLPIVAVFLLVVMNRTAILGEHRNGPVRNVLGAVVVLVATGLGIWNILEGLGIVAT